MTDNSSIYRLMQSCKNLLENLSTIFHPRETDGAEIALTSDESGGAFLFPQSGASLFQVIKLLRNSKLKKKYIDLMLELYRGIPCKRCAFRLQTNGGASLFWPIDISPQGVKRIAEAVNLTRYAHLVQEYLLTIDKYSCGLAIELCPTGLFRLRSYYMIMDLYDLKITSEALKNNYHFSDKLIIQILEALHTFGLTNPVVVNLAVDSNSHISAKFEIADVPFNQSYFNIAETKVEKKFLQSVRTVAGEIGLSGLNYLGIRYSMQNNRSLTAYLDAHSLMRNY